MGRTTKMLCKEEKENRERIGLDTGKREKLNTASMMNDIGVHIFSSNINKMKGGNNI